MEVMRTACVKSGTRSQHVSNYTWRIGTYCTRVCGYFAESERCFWTASFVSLFLFVGTHFRIFVRKFLVHLRTVYASPQKLARPLGSVRTTKRDATGPPCDHCTLRFWFQFWSFGYRATWTLSKADTSLKRRIVFVPRVSALERVDCIIILVCTWRFPTGWEPDPRSPSRAEQREQRPAAAGGCAAGPPRRVAQAAVVLPRRRGGRNVDHRERVLPAVNRLRARPEQLYDPAQQAWGQTPKFKKVHSPNVLKRNV